MVLGMPENSTTLPKQYRADQPVDSAVSGAVVVDPSRTAAQAYRPRGVFTLPEVRWAVIALVVFLVAAGLQLGGVPRVLVDVIFVVCYVAGGWEPALAGLKALRAKSLDVDLLMIVAAIGAAAIGQFLDGGLLIVIFATSGAQEAYATKRTQDSVRALLTLAPQQAARRNADGSETVVDTAALAVGDVLVVRPGESIGADGVVVDGASEVDQASITGEPLPVLRLSLIHI